MRFIYHLKIYKVIVVGTWSFSDMLKKIKYDNILCDIKYRDVFYIEQSQSCFHQGVVH
jgi:hypothetical protein